MNRDAGSLVERHRALDDRCGIAVAHRCDLAMQIGGHTSHVLVRGPQHRDRSIPSKPLHSAHLPACGQLTEIDPLERAAEASDGVMRDEARFRVMLTTGN
jgi:hypothetical protein